MAAGLAVYGADVVVVGYREPERVPQTLSQIRALGRKALEVYCDVTSQQEVDRLLQATLDEFGAADILVKNIDSDKKRQFYYSLDALKTMAAKHQVNTVKACPHALKILKRWVSKGWFSQHASNAAGILAHNAKHLRESDVMETMGLVYTGLKKASKIKSPDVVQDAAIDAFKNVMPELAKNMVLRYWGRVGLGDKLEIAEKVFWGLKDTKLNLLLYAVASDKRLLGQVPSSLEKPEREKLEFLKNLKKQAGNRSIEEIILELKIGKKPSK